MTTVKQIEKALSQLPPRKLAEFRSWYARFDAAQWDAQLEADARSGRLDALADKAIRDHARKRTRAL